MSVAGVAASVNRTEIRLRHSAIVRITHWIVVLSVLGLLVSGLGILISHPRLYWGETGYVGAESLIDVPIPFVIGPSVWNRPIHFFFAWILTFAGLAYVAYGFITRHFRNDLVPDESGSPLDEHQWRDFGSFALAFLGHECRWDLQCGATINLFGVVFALFPAIFWTGLAMSFGVTSVFPVMAVALGGHQSARTLHFVFVALLLLFVAVHIWMIYIAGFVNNVRAMITGYIAPGRNAR